MKIKLILTNNYFKKTNYYLIYIYDFFCLTDKNLQIYSIEVLSKSFHRSQPHSI